MKRLSILFLFLCGLLLNIQATNIEIACAAPTGLTAQATTVAATVSWTTATAATNPQIEYRIAGTAAWIPAPPSAPGTVNNTILGLTPCTTYQYHVRVTCSNGEVSAYSEPFTFQTTGCTISCTPPNTLAATPTTTGATITWTSTASSFILEYAPISSTGTVGTPVVVNNITTPSYTLTGLTPCTYYSVRLKAVCSPNLTSDYSAVLNFKTLGCPVVCLKPTALTAVATTNGANLTWTSSATNFVVEYTPAPITAASVWTPSNVAINAPNFNLTGLNTCTEYGVRVKAICASNSISDYSAVVTFKTLGCPPPCAFPTSLVATPTTDGATLTWVSTATNFTVEYALVNTITTIPTNWVVLGNIPPSPYTLTGLAACTYYAVRVKAVCSNTSSSTYSDVKYFKTLGCVVPCDAPVDVLSTPTANGAVVTWTSTASSFVVEYAVAPLNNTTAWTVVNNVTTPTYTLTGLTACTEYLVRVKALCNGTISNYSIVKTFKTLGCPVFCAKPLDVIAVPAPHSAAITWVSTATNFVVEYASLPTSSTSAWTVVNNVTTPTYTITSLDSCKEYVVRIKAICSPNSISDYSVVKTFKTTGCPVTPPVCAKPLDVIAVPAPHSAVVTWVSTATNFVVEYAALPTSSTSAWTVVNNVTTPIYTINGLDSCREYAVRIKAICSPLSISDYSLVKIFKTTGCPVTPPVCAKPLDVIAVPAPHSAVVTWVSTATNFVVEYAALPTSSTSAWTVVNNVTTPIYTINGLDSCREYAVRIKAICSPNSISDYSVVKTFKTTGCPVTPTVCAKPVDVITVPTTNTAVITWISTATNFVVEYMPLPTSTTSTWTVINNVTTPTYTLTGLTTCKEYAVRIKAICSPTNMSDYSVVKTFKTLGCPIPCPVPVQLTATNITTSGAVLNWANVASVYNLRYRLAGPVTNPWTLINNLTTSTKTLTGLLNCREYLFQVQSVCANSPAGTPSSISAWSVTKSFKTNCVIITPGTLGIYPNPGREAMEVSYNLKEEATIRIELVNLQGQIMRTLVSGTFGAGTYSERIENLEGITSGMYFVVLRNSNGEIVTQRWVKE
jgi:trimeric autotransporter adhesin